MGRRREINPRPRVDRENEDAIVRSDQKPINFYETMNWSFSENGPSISDTSEGRYDNRPI